MTHKVVFEIEVEAENPLEAAKEIQSWLDSSETKWQFYVQTPDEKVYSVDLSEDDDHAVLELMTKYEPMIK